jgi:hypothetical protein
MRQRRGDEIAVNDLCGRLGRRQPYSLTPMGFARAAAGLRQDTWVERHIKAIDANRQRFDAADY